MSDPSAGKETFIFGRPRAADRQAMAALMAQDMASLGVNQSAEALLEVTDLILADKGRNSLCLVVRPSKKAPPVGLILANVTFSLKVAGRALWIENLYVSRDWRRRGLGRLLVAELLDWAEDNNIKGIDLEAYQGNTPAAVLYRSLGFDRLSRERFYFSFSWVSMDE